MQYLRKIIHVIDIDIWDILFGLNATHKDILGQLQHFWNWFMFSYVKAFLLTASLPMLHLSRLGSSQQWDQKCQVSLKTLFSKAAKSSLPPRGYGTKPKQAGIE